MAQWGGERFVPDAQALLGDQSVYAVARSRTMKDVGLWVWFPRIWLFVGDGFTAPGSLGWQAFLPPCLHS